MNKTLFPLMSTCLNSSTFVSLFIYLALVNNTFMFPSKQVMTPIKKVLLSFSLTST